MEEEKVPVNYTLIVEYDNGDRQTFNDAEVRTFVADITSKARVGAQTEFLRGFLPTQQV